MNVRVGLWRRLSAEELVLLNCGVGEDSWESLGLKEIQPIHSEGDQPWDFFGRNDAKAETPILWPPHARVDSWKRLWCWEGLGAEGEGDNRGWDGWIASPTRWTWIWVNSGSWWWTGQGGVACCDSWGCKELDTTEWLNWTELKLDTGDTWRTRHSLVLSHVYHLQISFRPHWYLSAIDKPFASRFLHMLFLVLIPSSFFNLSTLRSQLRQHFCRKAIFPDCLIRTLLLICVIVPGFPQS